MKWKGLISLLFTGVIIAGGCSVQPPLYLRTTVKAQVQIQTKANINLMWQVDWSAKWTYRWDTSVLGPVGYTEPASMRVHIYALDAQGGHRSHDVKNFMGTSADIPVFVGTYDLLFHNNDSEVLLFKEDADNQDIICYTRIISSGIKTSSQVKTRRQKAETETKSDVRALEQEPVALMPDGLFSLFDAKYVITDNLDDYQFIDGKYVKVIEGELSPATYIHLFLINLTNNNGRVVGCFGGAALTGVASGVDLQTHVSLPQTASIPMDVQFDRERDQLGIRAVSYGIPGCNPYDESSVARTESAHFLVLSMTYANGTYKNIRVDITDAFRALPLGGVIDLDLDVDDFPPESGGTTSGGGFNALIDNWKEETGSSTIIN